MGGFSGFTRDSIGNALIVQDKPSGDFNTVITHNFCDNTTWSATNNSIWELIPSAGNVSSIIKAEVQFEHDVSISPTELYLDYYAWVGGGATALAQRISFSSMYDIFALGNEHYHSPALPEITNGISTIVFNYANKLRFYGDETPGSLYKLSISTLNDTQITGSYATVGFVTREESL